MEQPSPTSWFRSLDPPCRVLIIDDDEIVHLSVQRLLGKLPFVTRCVDSPSRGLELARRHSWDLVLLDLMMPEMSGLQLLASLREASVTTPVVAMTACPTPQLATEALRLGAADVVPKPFTRDELLGALFTALSAAAEPS